VSKKEKKGKKKGSGVCHFCKKKCQNCILPFKMFELLNNFIGSYKGPFGIELYWEKSLAQPPETISNLEFGVQNLSS